MQRTGNVAAIAVRLGSPDLDFRVLELAGREGLNELFEYSLKLSASVQELDLDAVLRSPCTIEVACEHGTRYIHGIVRSFERLGEPARDAYYYAARIVPLHWILTKRFGSRIFQTHNCTDMTVPGIIRKVLLDAGIPEDMFRFVLPRELPAREYVVQYRETAYDFIARLMEEEGLACHFEHGPERHVLVIGDGSAAFASNPVGATVTYCDPNGMDRAHECVFNICERRSIEYGAIGLTDFNFKRPGFDLRTRYPRGPLPGGRYSTRTAPPKGPPPYASDSPDYDGATYAPYEPESSDYGDSSSQYGVEASGPARYDGSAGVAYGQPSAGGYAASDPAAYGGVRPASGGPPGPDYSGNSECGPGEYGGARTVGPDYTSDSAENVGPGYGRLPIEAEPQAREYAPDGREERYARQSWDAPRGQSYAHRGSSMYNGCTPPAAPPAPPYRPPTEGPYAPPPAEPNSPWPGPRPRVDYGCAEVKEDYPGAYLEREEGQRRAQVQCEEHQCAVRVFELRANVRSFMAGYRFSIAYHPVESLNAEYVATEVVLRSRQSQGAGAYADPVGGFRFEVQVRAIPATAPYRPPCKTPRPFVHGAQTALVVGPKNDEIHTDAYGRVKVQFHWDAEGVYDEHSSCWVRASQGMAGGQYGMMFLPRVGQEVVVDFLEGNPDWPIITGRVYNSDCMPPYKLPEHKTRSCIRTNSSPGGYGANEIRFEDRKHYEHMLIHAQRDLHLRSRASCFQTVGGHNHTLIYGSHYEKIQKHSNIEVCLDRKEKVGGDQSLTVRGDLAERIYGRHYEACASYALKAQRGEVVIEAAQAITLKVGGNFIKIDAAGVHVVGTIINLNSGGSPGIAHPHVAELPKAPYAAYTTEYGHDVYYSTTPPPPNEGGYPSATYGSSDGDGDERARPTSWIEIELIDESGRPWPNESYEIIAPDGTVHNGTLDANGQAHVAVESDGECQIRFPRLDRAAWEHC